VTDTLKICDRPENVVTSIKPSQATSNFVPASVLIANIRLIGDVVLTTPLVALLKEAFPDVAIDMLVNRGTGEFLEKDPRIRRVLYSEKWAEGSSSLSVGYLKTIFRKYDVSICMNASDRGNIAAAIAGKSVRLGFFNPDAKSGIWWRKMFLSRALRSREDIHVVENCREVAHALGIMSKSLHVRIFWDRSDEEKVSRLLDSIQVRGSYFVVHPFARWRYKYWDINQFIQSSDTISHTYGLTPVWTSSPDGEEIELLRSAAARCDVAPLLVPGMLSLNQMACLIYQARLYIGLDTAISHIAASTGTPMVALYGPTQLWRWHPWNNNADPDFSLPQYYRGTLRSGHITTLQAPCEHEPCIRPNCYSEGMENPCMMKLTAQDLCREVDLLMASKSFQTDRGSGEFRNAG
jgi:heptosyltransferase-3